MVKLKKESKIEWLKDLRWMKHLAFSKVKVSGIMDSNAKHWVMKNWAVPEALSGYGTLPLVYLLGILVNHRRFKKKRYKLIVSKSREREFWEAAELSIFYFSAMLHFESLFVGDVKEIKKRLGFSFRSERGKMAFLKFLILTVLYEELKRIEREGRMFGKDDLVNFLKNIEVEFVDDELDVMEVIEVGREEAT